VGIPRRQRWTSETAKSVCDETGLADPVEGAIKLAESLSKQCEHSILSKQLDLLASWQGAKIQELEMDDAGRLIPIFTDKFDYLIQVNEADSQARKNFSACHEIGHTLMPNFSGAPSPRRDAQTARWDEESEEEFLCDVAGAELLMPRRKFVPRLRGCGVCIEAVQVLAQEFGASLEAAAVNITRARVADVAVIVWEPGWKKQQKEDMVNPVLPFGDEFSGLPEKKLRIKFACACGEMEAFHFPRNKSIEEDSLIGQAAATSLSVCGMQALPIGGNSTQKFYTQSLAFQVRRGDAYESKVFTMVQLKPPEGEMR